MVVALLVVIAAAGAASGGYESLACTPAHGKCGGSDPDAPMCCHGTSMLSALSLPPAYLGILPFLSPWRGPRHPHPPFPFPPVLLTLTLSCARGSLMSNVLCSSRTGPDVAVFQTMSAANRLTAAAPPAS